METEAAPLACQRRAPSLGFPASPEKRGGCREAGPDEALGAQCAKASRRREPQAPVLENPGEPGKSPAMPGIGTGCRVAAEEEPLPLSKPPCPPARKRDRSADVVDYIVKELQGISRMQTEIAELQQHLTLIKGSVDEVSSCVDSVLSEIEGLQGSGGASTKTPTALRGPGALVGAPTKEPVLYFYGIPEQEGENTKEIVCRFLSEYRCFNGFQRSKNIKEAYRWGVSTGVPFTPRPAVVKLATAEHRDFILQKSILLQDAGITIAEQNCPVSLGGQLGVLPSSGLRPQHRDFPNPQGEGGKRDGGGQLRKGSCQAQREKQSRENHPLRLGERAGQPPKPPSAKKSSLISELEEKVGRVVQIISSNEQTLHKNHTPTCVSEAPQKLLGKSWPLGELLSLRGLEAAPEKGRGRGSEAEKVAAKDPSSSSSSPPTGVVKGGGPIPGERETGCGAATPEGLSAEQVHLEEEEEEEEEEAPPTDVILPGCEAAVQKLTGSSETLKDLIEIDLNDQDPTDHVFRDVLENSQFFLQHSQGSVDLVDVRFYTNKLGKALGHFRSALQLVFHKLETADSEVVLGGDHGFPVASEPVSEAQASLGTVAESPASLSSESQANTAVSSDSAGSPQRPLPSASAEEAPVLPAVAPADQPFPAEPPQLADPPGQRPLSLEKVCAETIYLNRCINNFKNVLREKRQMRRRGLKELAQEPGWTSAEETPAGTGPPSRPLPNASLLWLHNSGQEGRLAGWEELPTSTNANTQSGLSKAAAAGPFLWPPVAGEEGPWQPHHRARPGRGGQLQVAGWENPFGGPSTSSPLSSPAHLSLEGPEKESVVLPLSKLTWPQGQRFPRGDWREKGSPQA